MNYRVLLCHNTFPVTGGAEVFYREVGRVLEQHGHDVAYFSCYEDNLIRLGIVISRKLLTIVVKEC